MNEELANYYRQMPIDIFTDASSRDFMTPSGKVMTVSSGYMAMFGFIEIHSDVKVTISDSVPAGEARAIDNAINWLKWYANSLLFKPTIRIFSDSMASLQALNNILNYYAIRKHGNQKIELPVDMRSSFNMAITVAALNILNSGFDFKTYYVPGHMDVYDKQRFDRSYKKFIEKFAIHNSKLQYAHNYHDLATYEFLYYAGINNNHIDVTSRNYLYQFKYFIDNTIKYLYNNNVFTNSSGGYLYAKEPINWPMSNNTVFAHPIQMLQPMMLT